MRSPGPRADKSPPRERRRPRREAARPGEVRSRLRPLRPRRRCGRRLQRLRAPHVSPPAAPRINALGPRGWWRARTVERCRPEESAGTAGPCPPREGRRDADLRPRRRSAEAAALAQRLRAARLRLRLRLRYSGPGLAGSTPRPAPSGDLQRVLASMQSSWGARRRLPAPPATEHARPRREGRAARLREENDYPWPHVVTPEPVVSDLRPVATKTHTSGFESRLRNLAAVCDFDQGPVSEPFKSQEEGGGDGCY